MKRHQRQYILENTNDIQKYIGRIFETKNYGKFAIIGRATNVTHGGQARKRFICRFIETGYETIVLSEIVKKGYIRDPYYKCTYGIGFLGSYSSKGENHPFHRTWTGMLRRCYDEEHQKVSQTYKDVSVCSRWHDFSKFIEDVPKILGYEEREKYKDIMRYNLDKDILFHNNREYSLNKCCFVPEKLNSFFANKQSHNSTGFEGIRFSQNGKKFIGEFKINGIKINIGTFEDVLDAYDSYHLKKKDLLNSYFANEFYFLDDKIKNACYEKLKLQYRDTLNKNGISLERGLYND